tara:strand:+ start:1038 stop:1208 length:171 start_codon:yes stop_codon:yes gene_type:complete
LVTQLGSDFQKWLTLHLKFLNEWNKWHITSRQEKKCRDRKSDAHRLPLPWLLRPFL